MKITIEVNGHEFSAKTPGEDISITEIPDMIKGLLIAATYHPATVDELFAEEFQWYNNEQLNKLVEDEEVSTMSWPADFPGKHSPSTSN
jgi:hypothetical protein